MSNLSLLFFGPPRMLKAGREVDIDTRKATALIAFLAVTGESHTRDALANLLWPEYPEQGARGALRRTLSTLRKALGEETVETPRDQVRLDAHVSAEVDVNRFRSVIHTVQDLQRGADPYCPNCIPGLVEAASYYRGDFLEGFSLRDSPNFDEWQYFHAERFRNLYAGVLEKLGRTYRLTGDLEQAMEYIQKWLVMDHLAEAAHREMMLIYHEMGQRSSALRQYRECARILVEELGVEPLEETTSLYHQILSNQVPSTRPRESISLEMAPPMPRVEQPRDAHQPLVGRNQAWEQINRILSAGEDGVQFVAVTGEAGIGKTRLVHDFLAQARAAGYSTAAARCYEGESELAYAPFIEIMRSLLKNPQQVDRLKTVPEMWLREAARLLPEILYHPSEHSPALTTSGGQGQFYEGLRQVLLSLSGGEFPLLIFLDDLHFSDSATLDFLSYLTRRIPDGSLVILGAWRNMDLPASQRLRQLSTELERTGRGMSIVLERLTSADVLALVETVPNIANLQAYAQRLYLETEGIPLFVVEYLSLINHDDQLELQPDWELPGRVRALIQSTLLALDDGEKQLLQTAAVIGRSFDYDLLHSASGRSEVEVVQAVESLLGKALIHEISRGTSDLIYEFEHDKLRLAIYAETSKPRLRLLHRRVADALVQRNIGKQQRLLAASQIAHHYQAAGAASEAAPYFKLAGDFAASVFANAEALDHYQTALSMDHPERGELHEKIGDLYVLLGSYANALISYETAMAFEQPAADLVRIERKIGEVHDRRGEWELAHSFFEDAIERLGVEGDGSERARVFATWSRSAFHQGNPDLAMQLAEQALELVHEQSTEEVHALVHNILSILHRKRGQNDQALWHVQESLSALEHLASPIRKVAAMNSLGLILSDMGKVEEAIQTFQESLRLCQQLGDRHHAAAIHNNLADLFNASRNTEEAMHHLKQAVILFAEVGKDDDTIRPEIWMLTEW